jgi:hypothetical protein
MMKIVLRVVLVIALSFLTVHAIAQDEPRQDAEGCKDSPLITRMPGSTINSCDNKEFEQAEMPVGKDAEGNVVNKTLEGEYHYWDMGTR